MEKSYKLAPLEISSNAITTFETWSKWKRALDFSLVAKGITDHLQKKAILMYRGGLELQEIYASLEKVHEAEATAAKDQYVFAIEVLDKYFKPTVNLAYERYVYRSLRQNNESIEQFVVRLRQQANNCEFAASVMDRELVDQVVLGTDNPDFRREILKQRLDKIQDVVNLGKLLFSVDFQTSRFEESFPSSAAPPPSSDAVARVSSSTKESKESVDNKKESSSRAKWCTSCGSRRHQADSKDCPAIEGTCYRCEKKGHFSNRCPDKKTKPIAEKFLSLLSPARKQPEKKKDEVKLVRTDRDSSAGSSNADYTFAVSSKPSSLPSDLEENRVRVQVGGVSTKMYVDSGASRVIFAARTWERLLRKNVQFKRASVTRNLFPYGKSRPLEVWKAVRLRFESQSSVTWAKAYILAETEGRCESILSSSVAKALNLLSVGEGSKAPGAKEDDMVRKMVDAKCQKTASKTGKLTNLQLIIPTDHSVAPVAQPCRRVPLALRRPMKEKTDNLLEEDIIERAEGATKWVSNVVPVIKKNGELRLCVDMRQANQAVLRERFPIPTFEEISAELCDCEFFSKIDLHSAYHQVELAPECRDITTFVTPDGLFRFKRLFFGIRCAPEIFQRVMQDVLRGLTNVRVFFDDIIIFSKSHSDHVYHVQQVMNRLQERGLTINKEKSIFGVREIEFLGHRISKNTIAPSESNAAAVRNFSPPQGKKDLQSFLGLVNFVSQFIPHFSTITAPLRVLLKKNTVFRWGEAQEKAFKMIKEAMANVKTSIFDPDARTMLLTDASPVGLGAVLLQQKKGSKNPEIIAFASHSLTPPERNYSQIEKEALGLVWGCEKFKMYLLGRHFELLTDHKPLEVLFGPKSKPNARLERWVVRLQCYDYTIQHVPGESNIADPFSRLLQPYPGKVPCAKEVDHTVHFIAEIAVPRKLNIAEIRQRSMEDNEITSIIAALRENKPVPSLFARVQYELTECEGILLRGDRIVPPVSLRKIILDQAHEGHPGMSAMKRRLRNKVWWPKIDEEAERTVKKCFSCALVSSPDPPQPLQSTTLPTQAWEYVAIDHLGPFGTNNFILVVVDYYSRFVEIEFTKSTSAKETIRLLWKIFSRHGFPARLKSDNAQSFRSEEFAAFLQEFDVAHITSAPLWPQANGEVERQNRSLLKRLKIAFSEGRDLEIESSKYLLTYNTTPHSTTGVAPANLLFNRSIREKLPSISQPAVTHSEIADRDSEIKQKGKEYADNERSATMSLIRPGDSVLLQARPSHKLATPFEKEPFVVTARNGPKITIQRGSQVLRRNIAAVKKCPESESSVISSQPAASTIRVPNVILDTSTAIRRSVSPSQNTEENVTNSPVIVGSPSQSQNAPSRLSFSTAVQSNISASPQPSGGQLKVTRTGRTIIPPNRLDL